jgi:hypothetical protein
MDGHQLRREVSMAKMVKGTKRYVLLRGKAENQDDIVIDIFSKKELDAALQNGRVTLEDNIAKVEVLGRVDLGKPQKSQK